MLRAAARGPIFRDSAARTTGASIATVNRQVSALLSAGLLRERADLTVSGAVGRPRVPVEVDTDSFATVGVHIGCGVTRIVAADLSGRILGGLEIATPQTGQQAALTIVARSARAFLTGYRAGGRCGSGSPYRDGWTPPPARSTTHGWAGGPRRSPPSSVPYWTFRFRYPRMWRRWPPPNCC